MKRIQVLSYCDSEHDLLVRATKERTVSVDGSKPVVLDLCDPCDRVFEHLLSLMERGAPAEQPPTTKKRDTRPSRQPGSDRFRVCPDCLHQSNTRSALGQHTRVHHGKGLKEYTDAQFIDAQRRFDEAA